MSGNKPEAPRSQPSGGKTTDLANILVIGDDDAGINKRSDDSYNSKGKKRKGSDSPMADVAERLGLPKSFPKAPRRERKPFSGEEDAALMRGFQMVSGTA